MCQGCWQGGLCATTDTLQGTAESHSQDTGTSGKADLGKGKKNSQREEMGTKIARSNSKVRRGKAGGTAGAGAGIHTAARGESMLE